MTTKRKSTQHLRRGDWLTGQRESVAAKTAKGFAQSEDGQSIASESAIEILRQRRGNPGILALKGVLASDKGKDLTFTEIRKAAAAERLRQRRNR